MAEDVNKINIATIKFQTYISKFFEMVEKDKAAVLEAAEKKNNPALVKIIKEGPKGDEPLELARSFIRFIAELAGDDIHLEVTNHA